MLEDLNLDNTEDKDHPDELTEYEWAEYCSTIPSPYDCQLLIFVFHHSSPFYGEPRACLSAHLHTEKSHTLYISVFYI